MKILVLQIFLCFSMIIAKDAIFEKFMEFTNKFNKKYSTPEEFSKRFAIFKNNLLEMFYNEHLESTVGINQFSDLTSQEFHDTYLNLKIPSTIGCSSIKTEYNAPSSLDWRTKGIVTKVRDLGVCGSASNFVTIDYFDSQSLIEGKSDLFSDEQIAECEPGHHDCSGGTVEEAFNYLQKDGLELNYTSKDNTCNYDPSKVVARVSDIQCLESLTVSQVQNQLATVGPLVIAVDARDFMFYSTGVLSCRNSRVKNHLVLLVGYTEDYWIIKNEWGPNWGEAGYARVSNKEGSNCVIGSYVIDAKLTFIS